MDMGNKSCRRRRALAVAWIAVTVMTAGASRQAVGGESPAVSQMPIALLGTLKSAGVDIAHDPSAADGLDRRFQPFAASGINSFALGPYAEASGDGATAVGYRSLASGDNSTAFGNFSLAEGANSIAFGVLSSATGPNALAFGNLSLASGESSTAIGVQSVASGANSLAIGNHSLASGENATAFGLLSAATGLNSTALGNQSTASGDNSVAVGILADADGVNTTAVGNQSKAKGANSTALGVLSRATGDDGVALGNQARAVGDGGVAIGTASRARGEQSVAIGTGAVATGANSIAIGAGSIADVANVVSFGSPGHERRLTNIADGVDAHDAATYGQLKRATKKLSGKIKRLNRRMRDQRQTRRGGAGRRPAEAVPSRTVRPAYAAQARRATARRNAHAARDTGAQERSDPAAAPDARRRGAGHGDGGSARTGMVANQLASLESEVQSRFARIDRRLDQTTNGVAMAMALAGSALPAGKKLAVAVNYGTFGGMSAVALSSHVRVDDNAVVSGGISYGVEQNLVGGRVGMQFAW